MARSTMEVAFLGTQKLAFSQNGSEVKIVKVFYGDEPDGQTENGLSIVSMDEGCIAAYGQPRATLPVGSVLGTDQTRCMGG